MTVTSRVVDDPARRNLWHPDEPRPIRVYEWRPDGTPAGTVLVSHGTGGSGSAMGWLADPMVAAGFRVVAVDHHGNDFVGGYHPAGFAHVWERPRDLSVVLDDLGSVGPVGVAGFSAGGYTAGALVGGRADPAIVRMVLDGGIELPPIPELPGAFERLREETTAVELEQAVERSAADLRDPRVTAAYVVAPAIGAMLTEESLAAIEVPVAVRWGDADDVNPFELHVQAYVDHISGVDARSVGADVRHEDFIESATPDPTVRDAVGRDAAAFFLRQMG
ncbi:hypothetical protein [Nocardioides sp. SR21]|uniref:alpha/beta hydrolase family protein n=1 Tax=Nocardioides sp. SR21 TaxID=2919501 RepID=UPI001FAA1F69|nr:hypothetical protein [Nocardioides sp. SR21]